MKNNYLLCESTFNLLYKCIKNKDNKISDCEHLLLNFDKNNCSIYGYKRPQIITLPFKPPNNINDDDWCLYLSSIFI